MRCNKKEIKELLPDYVSGNLDDQEQVRVRQHLEICDFCRHELSLLSLVSEETVPDPDKAFWDSMPDLIYRAVQEKKTAKEKEIFSRPSMLWDMLARPRWIWAGSAAGVILMISWFMIQAPRQSPESFLPEREGFSNEIAIAGPSDAVHFSELDHDEFDRVAAWAGSEFTSIAHQAVPAMINSQETDIEEELAELNKQEIEQFSDMIAQYEQEDS